MPLALCAGECDLSRKEWSKVLGRCLKPDTSIETPGFLL